MTKSMDQNTTNTNDQSEETERQPGNRRYNDPIFDNPYNTGTAEANTSNSLKIDDKYVSNFMSDANNDAYDTHRYEAMMESIYETFRTSPKYKVFLKKRKIPKSYLPEIFVFLKNSIEDDSYNHCEVFIAIASFLGVSEKVLYDSIPVIFKEQLLAELDIDFNVVGKAKSSRLF